MKRNWFFGLLLVTVAGLSRGGVTVVIESEENYPPYSFTQNGKPAGIYVDLVTMAANKLAPDYELVIRPVPWKRGLENLNSGRSLALIPPYLNTERAFVNPYSTPLYTERVVLFCTPEVMQQVRVDFPKDFLGLKIGINSGYTQSDKLKAAVRAGQVVLEEALQTDNNIKKLHTGRIDCFASDRASALYSATTLMNAGEVSNVKLLEAVVLSSQDAFIGYSLSHPAPYKDDFVRRMNAALGELKKAGIPEQLVTKYTR